LSSRNVRLSPDERHRSFSIARALNQAQEMVTKGERRAEGILKAVHETLTREGGVRVEYASLCHPETLEAVSQLSGPTLLAIAAWVGEVRLIDNRVLELSH
jgi:pantoate--beta-alanine ligase